MTDTRRAPATAGPWPDERLDDLRGRGDPELDAIMAGLIRDDWSSVARLYKDTLREQLDVDPADWPPELQAWWARDARPSWADGDLLARAAVVSHDWLPELLTSYLVGSLPQSYAGAKGARVLTRASLLSDEAALVRRVLETLLFVLRAVEPGALRPGRPGYELARKTRVFHALVRAMVGAYALDRREDDGAGEPWDAAADGVPVNQEDLLGTLWTFAVTPLQVIERAAIPVDPADKDAVIHLWCVVGHLLGVGAGVEPPLLPMTYAEAADCWAAVQRHQFAASPEGRALTEVLVGECRDRIPVPFLRGLPEASVYDTLGAEVAGYVGVTRGGPVRHLLLVNRLVFQLANRVPGGDLLRAPIRHFAKRFALEWLMAERAGQRPIDTVTEAQVRRLRPLYLTPGARRAVDEAVAASPSGPARPAPSTP